MALLDIRDLRVELNTWKQTIHAVNGLDLAVGEGEIVGLIGESGSGKSMTARAILRFLPGQPGIVGGSVLFEGRDLVRLPETEIRKIRGIDISFVSQDPLSSLNPVFKLKRQMYDSLVWRDVSLGSRRFQLFRFSDGWTPAGRSRRRSAEKHAVDLLRRVELPEPRAQLERFPHQLSGGMRQRALLALAMAGGPRLLIADEPTTALDVTVQAQILHLLKQLVREEGTSVLYISHDLAVVGQIADSIAVMYAGRVVERAPATTLLAEPLHPYTSGLTAAAGDARKGDLREISGEPADMADPPQGCPFHPRCPLAESSCRQTEPQLREVRPGHWLACRPMESRLSKPHVGPPNPVS
jgi:oligopeptide/dipeptide ABC transporter ATP-binding protein